MKNRTNYLGLSLLLMSVFLFFATSCDKENDDNGQLNVPVLSTVEITEISETTATTGGDITDDGGATITVRGVCWSETEDPTINDNKTEDGSGAGSFTSSITELDPNTTYYVRAYSTNSEGTAYGSTLSFMTLEESSFTDPRDGNVYSIVRIGEQVWMAENLKYLPDVAGPETGSVTTPYYYVYDYNGTDVSAAKETDNYTTYGVLYNWPAAESACPAGWHLPGEDEWIQLTDYLGGTDIAGGKLKATTQWYSPNTGATNETGFTALPGGLRDYGGVYSAIGYSGSWWSATESHNAALYLFLYYYYSISGHYGTTTEEGLSVRCVRD